jgi:hypothetical protein
VNEGFGLTMVDGRPLFRRPDGSPMEDLALLEGRAPP